MDKAQIIYPMSMLHTIVNDEVLNDCIKKGVYNFNEEDTYFHFDDSNPNDILLESLSEWYANMAIAEMGFVHYADL